jgi:hypothetical protein
MQQLVDHNATSEVTPPIIVSLGAEKQKRIKRLKRGQGPLMDEVTAAVDQARVGMGEQAAGKVFVPVVLIYRRRERRGPSLWPLA